MTFTQFFTPPRWFLLSLHAVGALMAVVTSAVNYGVGNAAGGRFWGLTAGAWLGLLAVRVGAPRFQALHSKLTKRKTP